MVVLCKNMHLPIHIQHKCLQTTAVDPFKHKHSLKVHVKPILLVPHNNYCRSFLSTIIFYNPLALALALDH